MEDNSLSQKKKITVEDLFSADFKIHDPEAKWISGELDIHMTLTLLSHAHDASFSLSCFCSSIKVPIPVSW